ncbi:ankyrin repeat domain-containing protein SOWAHB [Nematolebias whitei]|uniref:ankyrin repeat domain-containing protein SOWAHB n=1 Tax=Nematolebias whitei TaxID=451745 RepID=UPI0018982B73|nr:ankyrin repeat domain-containing protein SOWAHB [Nematolebias whitei]
MDLTQESILSLLIAEGGQVKKSELLAKFKASVDCVDPAEKERNRELFKTFVNNVAFVKEIDGARCVVLKKNYKHLLREEESHVGGSEGKEIRLTGEEKAEDPGGAEEGGPAASQVEEDPEESSVVHLALQRSKSDHVKMKRALNFDINKEEQEKENRSRGAAVSSNKSRPYALPLRMPPSATKVEIHKLKADELPEISNVDTFKNKKRLSSVESGRAVKKASEEARVDSKRSSLYPLEQAEHDWLVNCAAGHWNQVYGLLLNDFQRIEKKDFMSGFTVLHWAAKTGNSHMLMKFIDASRKEGVDVDINVKSHGGYTPLHIAALHDQECIMATLVAEYGASTSVRDNCGKRAHHYLHKGISPTVREMMGAPKAQQQAHSKVLQKDELDPLPDHSKSLHSISRLFQPSTPGLKKKSHRSGLYSLGEEREEGDPGSYRPRTMSSASMY